MKHSSLVSLTSGALRTLGLTPSEERIYLMLLPRDGTTVVEIAKGLAVSSRGCQRGLNALERKGLVTHSPEQVPRYSAVSPDFAAEVLIARRQSDLHHARAEMAKLRDTLGRGHVTGRRQERVVEILPPQAAARMFSQFLRDAKTEILCLERSPGLVSAIDEPDPGYLERIARGVHSRSITDNQLLNLPGTLTRLRIATAAGEQFRTYPSLPFKLVVVDRRMALLPLHLANPDGTYLLVRSSSLLDALCEMFEMYWREAAPFIATDTPVTSTDASDTHPLHADVLLALMASGLNDKSIEQQLNVSARTLARRIVELTTRLGASTRFQAGWLAAQRMHEQDASAATSKSG
jgi:sugar-specific transcriptional regulator TrmB